MKILIQFSIYTANTLVHVTMKVHVTYTCNHRTVQRPPPHSHSPYIDFTQNEVRFGKTTYERAAGYIKTIHTQMKMEILRELISIILVMMRYTSFVG